MAPTKPSNTVTGTLKKNMQLIECNHRSASCASQFWDLKPWCHFCNWTKLMIFIGSHHLALLYNSTVRQKTQKHLFHLPLTWHETTRNAGLGDIQRTGSLRKMGWLARAWLRAMISWVLGIPGLTSSNGSVLGSLSHRTVSVPSHLGYLGLMYQVSYQVIQTLLLLN